ncbi:hypothetical protein COLSTE_00227 [Collinsella stercoris DSM 13279]|uniref:Uncharacterized protein n=1 Tax=Collinsella stercoris DSM 13279 TaxID=445975 RepID=B6G836_9ACTN|nr:hypothetical protein COLSTE_00227 [Collinsella stercoris DSM 13279]
MRYLLHQRINGIERLARSGQLPVLHQLVFVQFSLGKNELQLAIWQGATSDTAILDIN